MDTRAKELIRQGEELFSKRSHLMSYWQEVADNFYVERADFTFTHNVGAEFGSHLMSSYPVMVRRDLGNAFGAMLRRDNWFRMRAQNEDDEDHEAKKWLEWATGVQRRATYDRLAMFRKATGQADHDFAAFGQAVITIEVVLKNPSLLYRNWHLRDVAWSEDYDGTINAVHRRWKTTIHDLVKKFGIDSLHPTMRATYARNPAQEVKCHHAVVGGDSYGDVRFPWVSIYLDCENSHVIREEPMKYFMYVIPRWQTVSGSQYAYSPATVAALPDARLLQSITEVLLSAGEKFVDPPMLAVQEAIRSDINLRRGGITWVDAEYDERLGEVLRPLGTDKSGLPAGFNINDRTREDIANAFYLNKLTLPMMAGDMTATEVSQRVEEYIRQSLPLFEPMEDEYNGQLCERTFEVLYLNGTFGRNPIPKSLAGKDITFRFESPLRQAEDKKKVGKLREALDLSGIIGQMDQTVPLNLDIHKAFRESLLGAGVDPRWLKSEKDVQTSIMQATQMAQQAQAESAPA